MSLSSRLIACVFAFISSADAGEDARETLTRQARACLPKVIENANREPRATHRTFDLNFQASLALELGDREQARAG